MSRLLAPALAACILASPALAAAPPLPFCRVPLAPHARRHAPAHRARLRSPLPAVMRPLAPWLPLIRRESARADVPPSLVASVVLVESRGRVDAESAEGAIGLMQVMPASAASVGVRDPWTAQGSVRAGARYLRWLAERVPVSVACLRAGPGGSAGCAWATDLLLSAYNAGLGGGWQGGYVRAVRGVWPQVREGLA